MGAPCCRIGTPGLGAAGCPGSGAFGWESRVTTVFLRQGHYATDVESVQAYSPADLTLERIDELVDVLIRADVLPNR